MWVVKEEGGGGGRFLVDPIIMLSLIDVILVGICFTRLTMLALEMRDEDESNYGGTAPAETLLRKEILLTRMR